MTAIVFSWAQVTIDAKNDISLWQKFVQLSKHRWDLPLLPDCPTRDGFWPLWMNLQYLFLKPLFLWCPDWDPPGPPDGLAMNWRDSSEGTPSIWLCGGLSTAWEMLSISKETCILKKSKRALMSEGVITIIQVEWMTISLPFYKISRIYFRSTLTPLISLILS